MFLLLTLLFGCGPRVGDFLTDTDTDTDTDTGPTSQSVRVEVVLDGVPASGITVMQGGLPTEWFANDDGEVTVEADLTVDGQRYLIASHPNARTVGLRVPAPGESLHFELTSFDPSDNESFEFGAPGSPDNRASTQFCSHCHVTINEAWYKSPHRQSASNEVVQDLYSGTAAALATQVQCENQGGQWLEGIAPGSATPAFRCYLGEGTLPAANPECEVPCDTTATRYGGCADCHAPGIDGVLGGRDMLEATGVAFNNGVHCDVCHHVESIDLTKPAGVAGRLHIVRPSEPNMTQSNAFAPLMFGPYKDVPNPFMGAVARDVFKEAEFCAGCHELEQEPLIPGQTLDSDRWPSGKLPVHTTYGEWLGSGFHSPCQVCHMPAQSDVGNSADLNNIFEITPGLAAGWVRPPGTVRRHAWYGPRQPEAGLLQSAAEVIIEKEVTEGELTVAVTVTNVGAGHALPTGEPLRSVILLVEAACSDVSLVPKGGHAIPDFGGYITRKEATDDWNVWPEAQIGDVIRVVQQTGEHHDYQGYGPFGDGTLTAEQKGMPVEIIVGSSTIIAVDEDVITFDTPLPEGDGAYQVRAPLSISDGGIAEPLAGRAGFGFARVLTDATGNRMVPHFLAVDIASDNRILTYEFYKTEHLFTTTCENPIVTATLVHRAYPFGLAKERSWTLIDSLIQKVTR